MAGELLLTIKNKNIMKLYVCEYVPRLVEVVEVNSVEDIETLYDNIEKDFTQGEPPTYISDEDSMMYECSFDYAIELFDKED